MDKPTVIENVDLFLAQRHELVIATGYVHSDSALLMMKRIKAVIQGDSLTFEVWRTWDLIDVTPSQAVAVAIYNEL